MRALLLGLVLLGHASSAVAQDPATLDQVDALVTSGRTEEARSALTAWWDASSAARGAGARAQLQRGLWLRGVLTVDPTQAALDFQRLVVEFPGGRFTDQALLRLAQIAEARGERTRAREQLGALLRDYPTSALRPDAERLLGAVEASAARGARAAEPNAAAVTRPSPTPPPRGPEPTADPVAGPAEADPVGPWTVQIGAFANRERALGLRGELTAAGIEVRLVTVPGSPLLRVRTGRFTDADQAQALRRGLAARGYDATVSADAEREEAVP